MAAVPHADQPRDKHPRTLAVYALRGLHITTKTDAVSSFDLILLLIKFAAFLRCRECFPLSFVPANGKQLRSNGVLRYEAIVVERLEQRDVWNPLLLQQIPQVMRVKGTE